MIITHSALECFKTCRRKFMHRYLKCIVPKQKSSSLEFGTAMHTALEKYFNNIKDAQMTQFGNSSKENYINTICSDIDGFGLNKVDTAKLKGLIIGYITKYLDEDFEHFTVEQPEKEFKVNTLCKQATFVGKIDVLVQDEFGKYYIIEHKTASIVDDAYIMQKEIDSQTMSYAVCIQELLGIKISGVVHDIIIKQKIKQKKSESEDEFCQRLIDDVSSDNFERIVVNLDEEKLKEFKEELIQSCVDLCNCNNYYKCTGNCLGRYGACEYMPLCIKGEDDNEVKELFEYSRAHSEISEDTLNQ